MKTRAFRKMNHVLSEITELVNNYEERLRIKVEGQLRQYEEELMRIVDDLTHSKSQAEILMNNLNEDTLDTAMAFLAENDPKTTRSDFLRLNDPEIDLQLPSKLASLLI
jgi:hypothetical protein